MTDVPNGQVEPADLALIKRAQNGDDLTDAEHEHVEQLLTEIFAKHEGVPPQHVSVTLSRDATPGQGRAMSVTLWPDEPITLDIVR